METEVEAEVGVVVGEDGVLRTGVVGFGEGAGGVNLTDTAPDDPPTEVRSISRPVG